MAGPERVIHPIEPVFDEGSRVLILGTMPSPRSRQEGFYYAHPTNRFWPVVAALWDEPVPRGTEARRDFALAHHLALWDTLASCTIEGASDASIAEPVANDLDRVLTVAPLVAVVTTGGRAAGLYERLQAPLHPGLRHVALPSTSAANAAMSLETLIGRYGILRELADGV